VVFHFRAFARNQEGGKVAAFPISTEFPMNPQITRLTIASLPAGAPAISSAELAPPSGPTSGWTTSQLRRVLSWRTT
jgi:hypothetical protein